MNPHIFPGNWTGPKKIYEIDATNHKVDLNGVMPLMKTAYVRLVRTTRTNVDAKQFIYKTLVADCILHSGSIDGLNSQQRTLKRTQMKTAIVQGVVQGIHDEAFAHAFHSKNAP